MSAGKPARHALIAFLFWVAALFALVMASLPHPPTVPGEPSDKIQHAIAFATLGVLGAIAFVRASALRLVVLLSAFGALIEFVQLIPALHRDSEPLDWIVDTIAAGAAVMFARLWARRKR